MSCNFDDIDICGYQDLSDTGINWSQIHNQSKTILPHFYVYCTSDILTYFSKILVRNQFQVVT